MRVVVVGAGIGGLALAQGLRAAGDEVHVFDRDPDPSATGGYRLHLDAAACAALRRLLPRPLFEAVRASSAGPAAFRQFAVTDHRLRPLVIDPQEGAGERLLIGRVPLRRLLTHGLGEALHFGCEFTHHETGRDGTVVAHFSDGSSARADLLVGADGVGSRVARAMAGRPTSAPVGLGGIAGRTPLDARSRPLLPDLLRVGPVLALGPGGVGAFLSVHDLTDRPAHDGGGDRVPADLEEPALVWGLIALTSLYPQDVRRRADLADVADRLLGGWSPHVRDLVRRSAPDSTAYFGFSAADPAGDLTPWPPGPVTCLGDAVHAMPPTGGRAAATAIRDADLLAEHLAPVRAGSCAVATAVGGYHAGMASYAGEAVRESLVPLTWIRALSGPAGTLAARVALPVAATTARGLRIAGRTLSRR